MNHTIEPNAHGDLTLWDNAEPTWPVALLTEHENPAVFAYIVALREEAALASFWRGFALGAESRAEKAEREANAYKRAKAENDERFQLEAHAQRERAEKAEQRVEYVTQLNTEKVQHVRGLQAERDALRATVGLVEAELDNAEDQPEWRDEDGESWVEVAAVRAAIAADSPAPEAGDSDE